MPITQTRRAALAAVLALPALSRAGGQEAPWPNRPVKFIVCYAPGGPTDVLSRLWCQKMAELTGQQFVVENRAGAAGNIGTDAVAKSRPDGYTMGMANIAPHAIAPTLYPSLPYHPAHDFSFFGGLWQMPNMLVVNKDLPATTIPELIALLRANPGKYSFGSGGSGTSPHLSGEMFNALAGVQIVHVPYRGTAPAMADVLAGRLQLIFDNIPGAIAQARQGTVRALGVTSAQPSPVAPDVPPIGRYLPGYEITAWAGACGPAGIAPAVVERIASISQRALATPELSAAYLDLGATPWWTTPAALTSFRDAEQQKLAPIIRASGARVD
jgi:tripartite-type tricarboxylate transporter receptor subunit TctC